MASNSANSPPTNIRMLLDTLTFLGLTNPNEKICFSTKSTVDSSSTYGWFFRRWYGENVDNLVLNLTSVVGLIEEALLTSDWEPYRIQILTKVIDFHRVLIDQISLYDKHPHTKASLIGLRDRISTILLSLSDEDRVQIKRRQQLNDIKFTVNVISSSPPNQGVLSSRLANER